MCKVKTGSDVQSKSDLQNLVTSTILRQFVPFCENDISTHVLSQLVGSTYANSEDEVRKVCSRTISCMEVSGSLRGTRDRCYCITIPFPSFNPAYAGAR